MSTRRPPSRPTPKTVRKGLLGKIPRGATGLGAIAAVNALAGFAREATLAYYFGASEEIDTFLVAFTIPRMLVEQAAQTVVFVILPLYVTARENGRHDEATLLLHKWFWFLAKAVGVACIVLVVFAYPIVSLVGQGLSPAAKVSAAWWLAQLAPYVWLSILASSFKVVLDANRHFVVPASARIIVTIAVIASCAAFSPWLGVRAMVPGYIAGALVAFGMQWWKSNQLQPGVPGFRRLPQQIALPLTSAGILLASTFFRRLTVAVDRSFASGLPSGSIAALNYGTAVTSVFDAVISATLATALFPVIARQYARGRPYKAFRTARTWSMFIVAGGMVPLAAFALWDQEIVALVFQRGAFGPDAVRMTAQVVPILAITSLLTGVSGIQMRLLLTQGNVRVVSSVAILVVVAKIGLNALLVPYFGLPGVAIATVIAMTGAVSTRFFYSWRFAKRDQTKRDAERASQAGAPDRERTSPADASEPHQTEEDDA